MKSIRGLFAVLVLAWAAALASTSEARNPPRDVRPPGPLPNVGVFGSALLSQCVGSYRDHRNAWPYRNDVDYCHIRGEKFWIPEVLRIALSALPPNQPPGYQEQLDAWWTCYNTYEEYQSTADECSWNGRYVAVEVVLKNMVASFRAINY